MITTKELSLEEKLRLLTGKNLWQTEDFDGKIPSIFFADGPHGLRKMKCDPDGYYVENYPSIAYPNLVNIANSWNVDVAATVGELIAEDCITNSVDVLLAPGVNIKRTPLCGRNFEYFSEDPYLAGMMAKYYIRGLHNRGVAACIKHFCVNNREISRYCQSSEISERALHEIYLTAFEIALTEKPEALMSSYNPINGVYAAENKKLLTTVLREKMEYAGLVISDWMGVKNSYKALKAGTDLRMPFSDAAYKELKDAYDKKLITEEEINRSVSKILRTIQKIQKQQSNNKITRDVGMRRTESLACAEESVVLLKNEGVLPLKSDSVCVIGELNYRPYIGGGGAAEVTTTYVQRPLHELLAERLSAPVHASRKVFLDGLNPSHNDREGLLLASKHDVSIVVVGNSSRVETEGKDRDYIRLSPKEEMLINAVAATGSKTVVVIEAGSAIDMTAWIDKVDAVLFAGYLGDNCNEALANILSGKTCPSGKLSETFPLSIEETFCKGATGNGSVEMYDDGILVGYRYYETKNVPVRYPFGYGLSYANFVYSDLEIKKIGETDFELSYTVTNISDVDGKEVSQVYVKDVVSTVFKPEKELKAFRKDLIPAHKSKRVQITLDKNAFAHYDVIDEEKYVENGEFIIFVGSSSANTPLKGRVSIELPPETQHSAL